MNEILKLSLPDSWESLSQDQLTFVYKTIIHVQAMSAGMTFKTAEEAADYSQAQINLYLLLKFAGFKHVRQSPDLPDVYELKAGKRKLRVSLESLSAAAKHFDFIREIPKMPVRLEKIGRASAAPADLHSLQFASYMALDNLWQGYLYTQKEELLEDMAAILYDSEDLKLLPFQRLSVFFWFSSVKRLFGNLFPYFLKESDVDDPTPPDYDSMRRAMNTQIRALTKGDVTKEEQVKALDVWSALTELDALAKEYEEMERKYGKK